MINEFYTELTCGLTGTDCQATAAWLQVALRGDCPRAAERAEAYYVWADEPLRYAVGELCGWCEPSPRDSRRCAVPKAVALDFNVLLERANALIGEF